MAEKIFDAQVNYGWGLTLNMTGKAPAISKRIFDTLADAQAYVDDANDSAIAGLQLSVIADTDTSKNGIYFVSKIGTASEAGTLVKIGSDAAASIEELQQKVGALETDVNALKSIDHTALENKIEVVKVNGKALDINDKAVDITIETPTYDADVTTAKDSTTTAPTTKAVYDFVDGIKTSLEGKLNAIETWKLEVVDSLEGIAEINAKTIYLVLADAQHQGDKNKYKEYIYVNDTWEQLGELDVAFDPADLQQQITDLGTRVDTIETNLGNLTTKVTTIENKIKEITEVGGEPNKIDTISLNSKAVSFTVDAAKNADLTLDVDYDTTTKKVRLKSGNTILSSFDASAFIKDGMLNSAEIITVPSDGEEATVDRPAGKYIKLTWNTDAGKDATYIPVKDIIKEYTFAGSADGISLHSATRGNVKITDTLTATTDSDGTIRVKSGGSLADGSWFTKVDEELDAVPTTYAKAADVDTSLKAKADKTELPTVSANGSISIQDTLNYGDNSFAIDLDVTKTGVNNEVKLSESGFTTWVSAVDTQVKTNTDAIAGIPENFIVGDGFNYSYQTTYEDSHGDTHYNDYILSFVPNIEVVDENGVKKVKIGIINTSPNQVEEVGDTANYNLLDTWKDKLNNASMQGHTHVIADITDFDTITTEDIDALLA